MGLAKLLLCVSASYLISSIFRSVSHFCMFANGSGIAEGGVFKGTSSLELKPIKLKKLMIRSAAD
jgi:hypothetical protein